MIFSILSDMTIFLRIFQRALLLPVPKALVRPTKNHKQFLVLLTNLICNMKGEDHVNSILIRAETTLIFRVSSLDVIVFRMARVIQKYGEGRSRGNFYLFFLNIWITDAFLKSWGTRSIFQNSKNNRKSLRTSFYHHIRRCQVKCHIY